MLNLAIECSAQAGSVALLSQQSVIAERQLTASVGSVVSMAPAIAEMLTQHGGTSSTKVGMISITGGPGSFTGLRAGLATAKMLGLAWRIPLVAVDTLQVIAAQSAQNILKSPYEVGEQGEAEQPVLVAVLNAYRKQVFAAAWRMAARSPKLGSGDLPVGFAEKPELSLLPLAPAQVIDAALWQAQPLSSLQALPRDFRPPSDRSSVRPPALPPMAHSSSLGDDSLSSSQIWISGPGLRSYLPRLGRHVHLTDQSQWDPAARWVGQLGWQSYLAGQAVSAAELSPNYVRRSAAEEARAASDV